MVAASSSGCTTRLTDFTVISTKNVSLPDNLPRGQRISGDDCVAVIVVPIGTPNLKTAIDNAIEKAGSGYNGLVDGVLYYDNHSFVFGSVCYRVEGTPINVHSKTAMGLDPERVWKLSSLR
jgi:hypothetical protein